MSPRLDADFAVGGSYKYLRGGPGACFLYVHPRHLDAGLRTLDIGWFAKRDRFGYQRPEPPELGRRRRRVPRVDAAGAQRLPGARGPALLQALGVERLRAYSLTQQRMLVEQLASHGIASRGARDDHGAFVVVRDPRAESLAKALREADVIVDARGPFLRLCPDVLTTSDEIARAAQRLAALTV